MKVNSSKEILRQLESFKNLAGVLYIAAHPDDENTELLAYLARGRSYRTAYLSLTRGDGGQNVRGADLGEKLGVARTQELLAARKIDGAHQFFTRAIDFGFSKSYKETLAVWDEKALVSDIVRVIRQFHPDIVITRFSPSPGGTHGQHTTATVLAMEAYKLAGDPSAFPELGLPAWQPKRLFWNASRFQKDKITEPDKMLKVNIGGADAITGETFRSIAEASRSMHKTQGFDTFQFPGADKVEREELFQVLDGEPTTGDIMDGIATGWERVEGGEQIAALTNSVISHFNSENPATSVSDLLRLREMLNKLPGGDLDSVIAGKKEQLDRILQECLGLQTKTSTESSDVVPGEKLELKNSSQVNFAIPEGTHVRWLSIRFPNLKKEIAVGAELQQGKPKTVISVMEVPESIPLTQPYWLQSKGEPGMFHVEDPNLIGTAENLPAFPVEKVFAIGDQQIVVRDEPVAERNGTAGNGSGRRLSVIPPVSLAFKAEVAIMRPGQSSTVEVEVKSARANVAGKLLLEAPKDWKVEPKESKFKLAERGQKIQLTFKITAPAQAGRADIVAAARVDGHLYRNQRQEINYPHLPLQVLQPPAVVHAVSLDLKTESKVIGYLPGAGDSITECLQQMGLDVRVLDDSTLSSKNLEGLDAIVLGVRALNVREKMEKAMPLLLSYVENGGTMIVQYNRPDNLKATKIAPFELTITKDRVTDEKAPITFLDPESPILNKPNKITQADFDGWVQERGLYFAGSWDEKFTPILACKDADEPETRGSLLVARYGKGNYVYTGLSFFRQLPAAIPGAYRLFANLLALGKSH